MNLQSWLITVTALVIVMSGCDRGSPVKPEPKTVKSEKAYPLKGVVKKVDSATGEVTITHEEIVGLMPKMTMPFLVKEKGMIATVKPDDEVEATLQVISEGTEARSFVLTDVKVVGHVVKSSGVIEHLETTTPEVLRPGELVPDFSMTTQEGKTLKLADLKGKVIVLSFIYTRCPSPEFCPAMDAKFAELARRIGTNADRANQVRLLSVSFDPEHDTPEVLTAHAARRGAKPPLWTFAVASHEELSKVAGPLGLTYVPGTREIDHNLRAAVIGADGRLVVLEIGPSWTPAELVKTIYERIPGGRK